MPFFTRLRRASVFLLRGQEKGTKEKATPHSRLAHSPCAPGPRACYGVRRQSIHGLASNWPTSCGPSFGQFLRSLAAIEGTPVARVVRARARIKSPSATAPALPYLLHPCGRHPPCRAPSPAEREKEMPAQSRGARALAWSWLRRMRSRGPPMQRQRDGGIARRVGARDCAQFDVSPWMDCRRTPGVALRSRRAGRLHGCRR